MSTRSRPGPKPSPASHTCLLATRLSAADMKRIAFAASMTGSSASELLRTAARQFLDNAKIPATLEPVTNA